MAISLLINSSNEIVLLVDVNGPKKSSKGTDPNPLEITN